MVYGDGEGYVSRNRLSSIKPTNVYPSWVGFVLIPKFPRTGRLLIEMPELPTAGRMSTNEMSRSVAFVGRASVYTEVSKDWAIAD